MKISFNINPNANTIIFRDVEDAFQLENIKLITQKSSLLVKSLDESSSEKEGHVLIIYLSSTDQSFKHYSNFEYLFEHDQYLEWKKIITDKFPQLAGQFPAAEKEAKTRQELYRIMEELENCKEDRNSFHNNKKQNLDLLRERVTELRHELNLSSGPRFDFL